VYMKSSLASLPLDDRWVGSDAPLSIASPVDFFNPGDFLTVGERVMPDQSSDDLWPSAINDLSSDELTPGSVSYPFSPPDNSGKWKWNSDVAQWVLTTSGSAAFDNTGLWILLGLLALMFFSGKEK